MSTCSKANTLLPQSDLEAILKAGCKLAKIQKAKVKLNELNNLPPLPHLPTISNNPTTSPPEQKTTTTLKSMSLTDLLTQEYLEGVIHLQHQSIQQANADQQMIQELHQADTHQISQLKETLLCMTIKAKTDNKMTRPVAGHIHLQKF
jgi:hypothetical protein